MRPPWKNYIRLPICSLSNILLMSNTTFDVLILVTVVARHVVAEEPVDVENATAITAR